MGNAHHPPFQNLSVLTILINHKTEQKYEKKLLCQWDGYAFPAMENFPDYEITTCINFWNDDTIVRHCIARAK